MKDVKSCPECGQQFINEHNAWTGIDAHWKSKHLNIMEYVDAWPLIRKGLKPGDSK